MEANTTNDPAGEEQPLLPHIADTVRAVAQLHADHHLRSTTVEKIVDRWTATLGQPAFLGWIAGAVLLWIIANLLLRSAGYSPIDPPPFNLLGWALSAMGLVIAVLILSTQRRSDQLSELREQMTLELASLTERKVAKIIELIEEQRRDSPALKNRVDHEASEMAERTDPKAMLGAIQDSHDEMISNADTPITA